MRSVRQTEREGGGEGGGGGGDEERERERERDAFSRRRNATRAGEAVVLTAPNKARHSLLSAHGTVALCHWGC